MSEYHAMRWVEIVYDGAAIHIPVIGQFCMVKH